MQDRAVSAGAKPLGNHSDRHCLTARTSTNPIEFTSCLCKMAEIPPTKAPVCVLWDFENASVPRGVSGLFIANRFMEVFGTYGPILSILAIGNVELLSEELQADLTLGAVKLVNAKALKKGDSRQKDVADKLLMAEMFLWALDHPAPSTIVLISADVDFATSISALKLRGYNIVLVPPITASRRLMELPNSVIRWTQVCKPVRETVKPTADAQDVAEELDELELAPSASQPQLASSSRPQTSSSPPDGHSSYSTPTQNRVNKHTSYAQTPLPLDLLGDEADVCSEEDLLDVCLYFANQGLDRVLYSRAGLHMQSKYPSYRKGTLNPLVHRALKAGWLKSEGFGGSLTLIFDKDTLIKTWEGFKTRSRK